MLSHPSVDRTFGMRAVQFAAVILVAFALSGCTLLNVYQPGPANLSARETFQHARFGVCFQRTDPSTPLPDDPAPWVALAKEAGARYVVHAARRGEADTAATETFMNRLGSACQAQHMILSLDYLPETVPPKLGRAEAAHITRELDGLLAPGGNLATVRFGTLWERCPSRLAMRELQGAIHRRKPGGLIGRARTGDLGGEEDYVIRPDTDLRDEAKGRAAIRPGAPLAEFERTLAPGASAMELIQAIVLAAGRNANLLVRVALAPDGSVPKELQDRLREVGHWLDDHSETIFKATGGPIAQGDWGVCTRRGSRTYLHYMAEAGGELEVPQEKLGEVKKAYLFKTGANLEFRLVEGNVCQIDVPTRILEPADTIIVLETR